MTWIAPLLPPLLLIVTALLVLIIPIAPSRRLFLIIFSQLLVAPLLVLEARQFNAPIDLYEPSPATPSLVLTLDWSSVALPFGLLVVSAVMARVFAGYERDVRAFQFGVLIAEAGALVFFAADNWITVTAAWLLMEVGLVVIPTEGTAYYDRALRALGWNLAGVVFWLMAGMLTAFEGGSLRLSQTTLTGNAAFLALAAVWIRSGLFPFHAAAPADSQTLIPRLGLPILAATFLLTRILSQGAVNFAFRDEFMILALVGLGVSTLITLGQGELTQNLEWVARTIAAPLWLLPFVLTPRITPALSVWVGASTFLLISMLAVAFWIRTPARPFAWSKLMWGGALLTAVAVPLTPGFWARFGLFATSIVERRPLLILLLTATSSLAVIPLARAVIETPRRDEQPISRAEYLAIVLSLAPILIAGLFPFALPAPFGRIVQDGGAVAYDALFKSSNPALSALLIAVLFLPLVLGVIIARQWRLVSLHWNGLPSRVTDVLELGELGRAGIHLAEGIATLIRQSLRLVERPPVAWLLFVAIWAALWVITLQNP